MMKANALPGPHDTLRVELDNGITVLARENFASPSVVVRGYYLAGAEDEPAEKAGLAVLTADTMERGTTSRSFEALYEAVEWMGAAFAVEAKAHSTSFGGKALRDDLPALLEIIADVIRHPAFDADEFRRAKGEHLTDLEERAFNPREMSAIVLDELLYPEEHLYHRSIDGTVETIQAIRREDVADFHARYTAPAGAVIVIVGGIKAEEAVAAVEATFGDWHGERPPRAPLPPVGPPATIRRRAYTIADKSQVVLRLGWLGPARSAEDFLAAHLANTILGVFGMMGRLGKRVREENGLAYYVYSHLGGGIAPSPWQVIAGVDPANVEKAVRLIVEECRRFLEEPIPDEEIAESRAYLIGSLPLSLETNEGVANTLTYIERFRLGLDYLQRYPALIQALDAEAVQAAARHYLDPDRYALALAGPLS